MAEELRYGVKKVVLTELNADGTVKTGGLVVTVDTPQEVSFDPQVTEGNKAELRGGDKLIGSVQEADTLTGLTATFRDALLNYEAMKLLAGGTLIGTAPNYTGWEAPTLAQQAATPASPFKAEIYCSRYPKAAQMEGAQSGYTKVTLWYGKSRVPAYTMADRGFVVPSYTIKSMENAGLSKGPYSVEDVAALP